MDFIDQLKLLSKRVVTLKEQIQTEEATKTSLIMPFFQVLGYDIFNPLEFVPDGTPTGKKYPLENINSIFNYADELIESAKRFAEEDQGDESK